ncbi:DUF1217 domain-containing protein [uncultured Hyphomicrobium sp.]|uniref:DUF1217 domain-containing protein n=1 Tax=uncultured Hyphomicrobium sp. TaxID=194373 RepID=UPI0025FECB2E|nr:DUF1217 domain-containing protein [uncultured Hyphomicrobium sp.]
MISTFLSYRMYTADYAKSVQRTLSNAQVAREQTYYRENISKVTSVDDFLKDQRLYAYAMKAYGLEDMTYAKAFMRKVLESDVTDSDSFVRKLVDRRYLEFARAFNFNKDGSVSAGTAIIQDKSDLAETVGLYSEQRLRKGAAVAAEVEYYQARMATISSADQFVADDRLFKFALTSFGINADIASESAIKSVISGDLSVVANAAPAELAKYQKLAAAFSFQSDGSVASGGQAQTATQLSLTIFLNYDVNNAGASPAAAAFKANTFDSLIAGVTSVDDLVNNPIMREYAVVAAGIDPILVSPQMVRDMLTSDLSDPDSYANTKAEYAKLASMFNFNTDGSLDSGVPAQTTAQHQELTTRYFANYQAKDLASEADKTSDYKSFVGLISNVDALLKDTRAYRYIMDAYGIDRDAVSTTTIRQVLTSDLSDPFSFANRSRDPRFKAMAAAFNFDAQGNAQGALKAQYASAKSDTIARYMETVGEYDFQQEAGELEGDYFSSVVDTVETVDQLLADKRVVTFLKKAYGFQNETSPLFNQTLRRALTSDPSDPKSFVNQSENARFRELAAAFNFTSDGSVRRAELGSVQDPNTLVETQDLYLRQTMEQAAGDQNEGVRLALYFQRKAPNLTSSLSVLADKALMEVVMTTLGLPDSAAQADVDVLANMISKRIDVADFKDPAKLEKFLARFSAMYDLANSQASTTSIPSLLLGQQTAEIGQDLLSNIQAMYLRS